MSRIALLVLAAVMAMPIPQPPARKWESIKRGMSMNEVQQILGAPTHQSRQILFRHHLEQWQYNDPAGRVEFQCAKGEEPFVLGIYPGK